MDGHGNNVVPECFWMTYLSGVPVPIPADSAGRPHPAGRRLHLPRARRAPRGDQGREADGSLPAGAAKREADAGGGGVLVHLMYGDIDECCRLFGAPTTAPAGLYATC